MPPSDPIPGLWPNQIRAITNLEKSLADDKPRALVQMATGSGKSLTSVAQIYRLIKFAGARRVLFLVDRDGKHFDSVEGGVSSRATFSPDGSSLLYAKHDRVDAYGSQLSDLYSYHIANEKETRLTH